MNVRNLTTLSDEEFLQQSVDACAKAVAEGNEPLAHHWADHGLSFIEHCRHEAWKKEFYQMINGDGRARNPVGILNAKIET